MLTGQWHWRLEEAANLQGLFPKKFKVYPDLLKEAGYHSGMTGKGWGPGNFKDAGWPHNPAGKEYNQIKTKERWTKWIAPYDYFENFKAFLADREEGQPFVFWYGSKEPHGPYVRGSGLKQGYNAEDILPPPFLQDTEVSRSELADYYLEVEWFDLHLGRMMEHLEQIGELENTIIVVASDNGMNFPRAKCNLYDMGGKTPLAVMWPSKVKSGLEVTDFVSLADLAPTFMEAAGLDVPDYMTGQSWMPILEAGESGRVDDRNHVLAGRERHGWVREGMIGYPSRSIRTDEFLYIRNYEPDRWPIADLKYESIGYYEGATSHMLREMLGDREKYADLIELAFGKRPAEELYDLSEDPDQLVNLAGEMEYAGIQAELATRMENELVATEDPRVLGGGDIFDTYPYFGKGSPFYKKQKK